jgi:hypothetical protein
MLASTLENSRRVEIGYQRLAEIQEEMLFLIQFGTFHVSKN